MDFTREPIIETVITPKEGFKLAIRSSKNPGHEEFFVDAVEVVSFGSSLFFRSMERPKAFIVPVSDYEVLEVRETRLVLKNVGVDRSIKIAGGREGALKTPPKEIAQDKEPVSIESTSTEDASAKSGTDAKGDRKRDRRRQNRRRRGRDEIIDKEEGEEAKEGESAPAEAPPKVRLPLPRSSGDGSEGSTTSILSTLLPPPPTLISETIAQYRNNALFKEAFFLKNEDLQPAPEVSPEAVPQTTSSSEPASEASPEPVSETHSEAHAESVPEQTSPSSEEAPLLHEAEVSHDSAQDVPTDNPQQ